ncbi:hypothetical protein MRB53_026494 [Persea americana]|uniref:Uncharacterized protein n=1 Tax=Persea americana TaxID=3435 RepID=A0ACC2LIJ1_PERAE|nr:hypothetical protein MRB53_026494 [Persea americana]
MPCAEGMENTILMMPKESLQPDSANMDHPYGIHGHYFTCPYLHLSKRASSDIGDMGRRKKKKWVLSSKIGSSSDGSTEEEKEVVSDMAIVGLQ